MKHAAVLVVTLTGVCLLAACSEVSGIHANRQGTAPNGITFNGERARSHSDLPIMPTVVDFELLPTGEDDPNFNNVLISKERLRPRTMISDDEAEALRQAALSLPVNTNIQLLSGAVDDPLGPAVALDTSFAGPDRNNSGSIPPDPEMAAGADHVIAIVNSFLEIYDKTGTLVGGPTQTDTFFTAPGCGGTFDPNVLYDESEDRWVIGVETGSRYCVAVSQTGDPTGLYNQYSFITATGSEFFDYPHAGVGEDAIFVGANIFIGGFARADVWAIDKQQMYAGAPLTNLVQRTTNGDDTPQPMKAQGFFQGTWPSTGVHYIITSRNFNGRTFEVWSWDDPFGADTFTDEGTVDLDVATGVPAGFPVDVPQSGGTPNLQALDWRPLDAEYRNGSVWFSHTMACNPGGGTVDCVRWAQIDPTGPSVLDAGVFASDDGVFRWFPDIAVNHCDDMLIGYSRSSASTFPSVYATGRLSTDPPGTVGAEVTVKDGEVHYTSASNPTRWGDYSGAAQDPDGQTMWYLGEYSTSNVMDAAPWGNYFGRFSTGCEAPGHIFSDGFESGDVTNWSTTVP